MKILLAVDDSKFSEAATQSLIARASQAGAEVRVLHVVDLAVPIPTSYAQGFRTESRKQGEALVAGAAGRLRAAGFKVETTVEEGDPRARIVEHAVRWPADLVVLGSHGRKGLQHFLMGSVAETVSRYAPCSVEIVRPPQASA